MAAFAERLIEAIRRCRTPLVVGIDPIFDELPKELKAEALQRYPKSLMAIAHAYDRFVRRIIDRCVDKVPAVKFQMAYFEVAGPAGLAVLQRLLGYASEKGLVVILDGKRNDIGSTAAAYARSYLGRPLAGDVRPWQCDALTVNPYLGQDGLEPFVNEAFLSGNGVFVLVRTSNPGAGNLQGLEIEGRTISAHVADWVEGWSLARVGESGYGPIGAVVGATAPTMLEELRRQMPHALLLVPGYGAQGGNSSDVSAAFRSDGLGAIINSSRAIIYANRNPLFASLQWQEAVSAAIDAAIIDLRQNTLAGNL